MQTIINSLKTFFIFCCVFVSTNIVFGNYSEFLDQLNIMDISVDDVMEQPSISRYDLAKLLNSVECQDCIHSPEWMVNRYTSSFWENFIELPGKDFDEISYR